jgi:hypothetical protein
MERKSVAANEAGSSPTDAEPAAAATISGFSLATLMLVVTLVSIICGLSVVAPGVGLAAAAIALPALARTAMIRRHACPDHAANTLRDRLDLFLGSVGFVIVFGLASGICCFATCWPGFFVGSWIGQLWEQGDYPGIATGLVFGFTAGGLVACLIGYFALTRLGLPFSGRRLSRGEKIVVAGVIALAVIGGFFAFFRFLD